MDALPSIGARPVKLYSVSRFRNVGSTTQYDTAVLSHDLAVTHGDLISDFRIGELDNLSEGSSAVVDLSGPNPDGKVRIIQDGLRVTCLPAYRYRRIVFDQHTKEYVRVSNGKCVLDHSTQAAFKTSHTIKLYGSESCQFAPSEAIALRVACVNGKVSVAWTYRAVNPCDLRPVSAETEREIGAQFDAVLSRRRSARFVGRI